MSAPGCFESLVHGVSEGSAGCRLSFPSMSTRWSLGLPVILAALLPIMGGPATASVEGGQPAVPGGGLTSSSAQDSDWSDEQRAQTAAVFEYHPSAEALGARFEDLTPEAYDADVQVHGDKWYWRRYDPGSGQMRVFEANHYPPDPRRERQLRVTWDKDPAWGLPIRNCWPASDGTRCVAAYGKSNSESCMLRGEPFPLLGANAPKEIRQAPGTEIVWNQDGTQLYYVPAGPERESDADNPHELLPLGSLAGSVPNQSEIPDGTMSCPAGSPIPFLSQHLDAVGARVWGLVGAWTGHPQPVLLYESPDGPAQFAADRSTLYELSYDGTRNGKILAMPWDPHTDWIDRRPDGSGHLRPAEPPASLITPGSEQIVLPESDRPILRFVLLHSHLLTEYSEDGASRLILTDRQGKHLRMVYLPFTSTVSSIYNEPNGRLLIGLKSFLVPETTYELDPDTGDLSPYASTPAKLGVVDYTVTLEHVPAADGASIPMWVICQVGTKQDGTVRTILAARDSYSDPLSMDELWQLYPWLEAGGAWALPLTRGSAGLSPGWRKAGMGANSGQSVDDFITCADWLCSQQFTSPANLAAIGSNQGGVIVGAAIAKRPELFRAAILHNTRFDLAASPLGPGWRRQFGDPSNPEEIPTLDRLSLGRHLPTNTGALPSLLIIEDPNDPVFASAEERGFVSRCQSVTSDSHEVFLLESDMDNPAD